MRFALWSVMRKSEYGFQIQRTQWGLCPACKLTQMHHHTNCCSSVATESNATIVSKLYREMEQPFVHLFLVRHLCKLHKGFLNPILRWKKQQSHMDEPTDRYVNCFVHKIIAWTKQNKKEKKRLFCEPLSIILQRHTV